MAVWFVFAFTMVNVPAAAKFVAEAGRSPNTTLITGVLATLKPVNTVRPAGPATVIGPARAPTGMVSVTEPFALRVMAVTVSGAVAPGNVTEVRDCTLVLPVTKRRLAPVKVTAVRAGAEVAARPATVAAAKDGG